MHVVFKKQLWGKICNILENVIEGQCIPLTKDFYVVRRQRSKVEKLWVITSELLNSQSCRNLAVERSTSFLGKLLDLVTEEGMPGFTFTYWKKALLNTM